MKNTVHIDAALNQFSDTFETFKAPPILTKSVKGVPPTDFNWREYRIMHLRWMEFGLSLMHGYARNTLSLIEMYREDDDDDT